MPKYLLEYRVRGVGQMVIEAENAEAAEEIFDEMPSIDIVAISGLDVAVADDVREVIDDSETENIAEYCGPLYQYYVDGHVGRAGNNKDLHVTARDPTTAVRLWMEYYEITREDLHEYADDYSDVRLSLAPPIAREPMAHPWDSVLQWNLMMDGTAGPHTDRD